ncbi:MAG TPA: DNA alkylation repair protein [Ideonella sp.]|uniref:DNA alkylation repair protein n=1 Tax=Ideonella sp. TaxID=1929293 RepID=UPI002B88ACB0|nr:DNA alkylation repair protein [Ideonella sp.]HSI49379.1 DNA alkylation repair protein [Ideonella sp.]
MVDTSPTEPGATADKAAAPLLRHRLHAGSIAAAAHHLHRHARSFDSARFTRLAGDGLEDLELKARAMQIAAALDATLPADFDAACDIVARALAPAVSPDASSSGDSSSAGLAGWIVWPLGDWVARRVAADASNLDRGLQALHALTQRFTAEFAIRPLLRDHQAAVFATLQRWCDDPNEHVRRLCSEGSRPRLPWGLRLQALVRDPSPSLPLLDRLQDDPSAYVRRSVANHLNDIAKDHPALLADWLERHLPQAGGERRALLRHASRTLIKSADVRVLAAWGQGQALLGDATLAISPARITLGGAVQLSATLCSTAAVSQTVLVDYLVHHVKADGRSSAKVFKGWQRELGAGQTLQLQRSHALKPITTRRYYPGVHKVELQVNGAVVAETSFELLAG